MLESQRIRSGAQARIACVAGLVLVGAVAMQPLAARAENAMQIVVGNGPLAGTYTVAGKRVLCTATADAAAASYKYFDVPNTNKPGVNYHVRDAKTISEGQIEVDNAKDRGPKRGSLQVTFGNRGDHAVKYLVFAPDATLRQVQAGSGVTYTFTGHTKDGVALAATASCREMMKL